jgi:glycosyltransferase involved in cell wall biosynthesis
VLTRLCEAQAAGRRVLLVTGGASGGMRDWPAYRRRLSRAGIAHHAIDFFHRDSAAFWSGVERLAALIRAERPAVIHAHAGVPAAACAIARDLAGRDTRLIGQMYSWGPNRPEWMNVQDMWGFARTDRVVCSARAYWNLLIRYGVPARRLVYLPWGLPIDELPFRGVRQPATLATIGFVGRIEPRKNQAALVETLARLRRRIPDARLDLVGPIADPAYAAEVRAAIDRHDLAAAVTLHERVPRVLPFLQRWRAFVSVSADEGQGLAVLEAMAVGTPVVAWRVAGIEDFLSDGKTGLALSSASPRLAAAAVLDVLINDAATRSRVRGARRLVERRYDWRQTLLAFDRLYRT